MILYECEMSDKKQRVSEERAIGMRMVDALTDRVEGQISSNYKGRPRNANPNHSHNPKNRQLVAEWTQNKMQEHRQAATIKK
ncbi:unnamed protein product [Adineta steineri]|uniref:Uncharacterized protein n=1 Tax=Adineta steineri TaxID=433720 RepID=A0A815UDF1_9BILA|nr:unnamed protein product [Adineta steineri]CAF1535008.1 unnamed protein product [Adineta steineri]CAF4213745.1 unnamed protein product [Adineta steineri]CAF4256681.1 unnamed protein product [Adineta steineri]